MNWRTLLGTLILISSWSVQSCKDDEPIKWVDLRYKAADSYTIAASGEETVSIQVNQPIHGLFTAITVTGALFHRIRAKPMNSMMYKSPIPPIPHWTIVQIPSLSKVITGLAKR